jgi:tRNA(fMet)-specific endonuclease VapC
MKAFDTDILTEILAGNPAYAERIADVPLAEQAVPIVAVEEIIRGRLNAIRQAEAGKARITIERAYALFEQTLDDLHHVSILSFTQKADGLLKGWQKKKIKGSTHDLRIAATCVVNSATLVTRNRRDFQSIPGLSVEFWD